MKRKEVENIVAEKTTMENKPVEKILANTQSEIGVFRLLNEMAVAGRYTANSYENGFPIFTKVRGGRTEELTAKKRGKRWYSVIRRTKGQEG